MLKDMDFQRLKGSIKNKYWIKDQMLLKKQFIKQLKFIRNKIAEAVTKSNNDVTNKQEPVKEIIIPPEESKYKY